MEYKLKLLSIVLLNDTVELTGTFKQMKMKLVEENFDPGRIEDPLYILDDEHKSYVPLTAQVHSAIIAGTMKL